MTQTIVLVRHGRSAHVQRGLIDLAGFHRWRAQYESAGIAEDPPSELRMRAAASGVIVCSTARRAVESARVLDPYRAIESSPLLDELQLLPPNLRFISMPLVAWAIAIGIRWALGSARGTPAETQRSQDAAAWLSGLAQRHDSVLAVTHASFRLLLSDRLVEQGWTRVVPNRRASHWSAWSFSR